jgi:hypothetical protein
MPRRMPELRIEPTTKVGKLTLLDALAHLLVSKDARGKAEIRFSLSARYQSLPG